MVEADREAVKFYIASGFAAVSLDEKYPGVERFAVRSRLGEDAENCHRRSSAHGFHVCWVGIRVGSEFDDQCRHQYGSEAVSGLRDSGNPNAWYCRKKS